MLSAKEKAVLKQFKASLEQVLGTQLVELKVFGSKAHRYAGYSVER